MQDLIILSEAARRDLSWWVTNLAIANGKPLKQNDPDLVVFTTSSLTGWGGFCNGPRILTQSGLERLETVTSNIYEASGSLGNGRRPVCITMECAAEEVCKLASAAGCMADKCPDIQLDEHEELCHSTFALIKDCLFKLRREQTEIKY
ncbi:hypothetical protein OUZ56_012239 [Daphnia magna]|uniref:Uncharacterized protein n=1 Tax=Daphnia magna TaxID=35525 RepID=A0ABQ9Z2F1_9CRUS|nr:hypothetical protein OUZ56_012239 [Daphnia magna]